MPNEERKTCVNCKHYNEPKWSEPCVKCKDIIYIVPSRWEARED